MTSSMVFDCLQFLLGSLSSFITGNLFVQYILGIIVAGFVIKLFLYMIKGGKRRWEV